jgi:putative transposase
MVKNRHLAKSILDAGWGYFVARLHAKAAEAARVVVEVDSAYTSKTCSGCGHIFENLTLKDRWVDCRCGLSLDRDHNAAINILKRAGHVRWGISTPLGVLPQEAAGL